MTCGPQDGSYTALILMRSEPFDLGSHLPFPSFLFFSARAVSFPFPSTSLHFHFSFYFTTPATTTHGATLRRLVAVPHHSAATPPDHPAPHNPNRHTTLLPFTPPSGSRAQPPDPQHAAALLLAVPCNAAGSRAKATTPTPPLLCHSHTEGHTAAATSDPVPCSSLATCEGHLRPARPSSQQTEADSQQA